MNGVVLPHFIPGGAVEALPVSAWGLVRSVPRGLAGTLAGAQGSPPRTRSANVTPTGNLGSCTELDLAGRRFAGVYRTRLRLALLRSLLAAVVGFVFVITGIRDQVDRWNIGFGLILLSIGIYGAFGAYQDLQGSAAKK